MSQEGGDDVFLPFLQGTFKSLNSQRATVCLICVKEAAAREGLDGGNQVLGA